MARNIEEKLYFINHLFKFTISFSSPLLPESIVGLVKFIDFYLRKAVEETFILRNIGKIEWSWQLSFAIKRKSYSAQWFSSF